MRTGTPLRILVVSIFIFSVTCSAGMALSMSSSDFVIRTSNIDAGIDSGVSTDFVMFASVGQAASDTMSGDSNIMKGGYIHTLLYDDYAGPVWFVNDARTASDSFTHAGGHDTWYGDGSKSRPFLTITRALKKAKAGDTIFIDAGVYSETVVIDTDYIALIGKDSNATVIDPPGANSTSGLYGIYADTQTGITIKTLVVTGAYDGIHFHNVDNSRIEGDSVSSCGNVGIYLRVNSDTNTIINNTASSNSYGIFLDASSSNTVSNNTASLNSNRGIHLTSSSSNTVSNNTASSNLDDGISLNSSSSNTVSNNTASSNSGEGIYLNGSSSNTVSNNTASSNSAHGILLQSSSSNTVGNNTVSSNSFYGIYLDASSSNTVSNNMASSNLIYGISLYSSSSNTMVQNTMDSNVKYQIYIYGTSSSDTVQKNNIKTSTTNPDSGVYNASTVTTNKFTFTRNYWNSTDTGRIKKMIFQESNGDSVIWQPFRLGHVDTAAGADTTAPKAPDTVAASAAAGAGTVLVTWSAVTANEEGVAGSPAVAQYRVYRATVSETSSWTYLGNSASTSYTDNTGTLGVTYYYRVTARDGAAFPNESFYSDSVVNAKPSGFTKDTEPMGANAGVHYSSIQWGDYDNDGDLDLAVSGFDGTTNRLIIYRNNGGGSFTNVAEPMGANAGVYLSSIQWGDYDNDGDLDLAVSGQDGSGNKRLIIYRNNGGGSFTNVAEPMGANAGVREGSIQWGDYDNDGDLDLAVSGYDGSRRLIIYRNDGGGSFTNVAEPMGANAGVWFSSIQWGDYDNDGDLDLAVSGRDGSLNYRLIIYRNDGGGSFTSVAEPMGTNAGVYQSSIQWGDYDNDGDLDLAVSGYTGSLYRLILYRSDTIASANVRPAAPVTDTPKGAAFAQGDTVTFRWTKVSTDTTPDTGMTYNLRVGSAPGKSDIIAADTNSADSVGHTILGNAQNDTSAYLIRNLGGGTYYWSIQAVDGGMMRSAWAPEETFTITAPYSGPGWFVNDMYTASDSYTYSAGSDTAGDGSVSKPFRSPAKALQKAKSGDTIYVDAGLFNDTYVEISPGLETSALRIDTDYLSIIGKDSSSTIIDPPGPNTVTGYYGVYADTQIGLLIKNLGIIGANHGIYFDNVSYSTITNDSIDLFNGNGAAIHFGRSDSNTLSRLNTLSNYRGIEMFYSSNNTINNVTANSNLEGIFLNSCTNTTIIDNTANLNSNYGVYVISSNGSKISRNRCYSNNNTGILISSSSDNVISDNIVDSNSLFGIYFSSCFNHLLLRNKILSNRRAGIALYQFCDTNFISENEISNNDTGIWLRISSSNNTISKNNIYSNNVSNFYNQAGMGQPVYRNWWGTTDEVAIKSKFSDTAGTFSPYRLGLIDTSSGSDTTAPATPTNLTITKLQDGYPILTWILPTATEETNGGSIGYTGTKIYRIKNQTDTSNWANSVNLVRTTNSTETTWTDTTVTLGNAYYYRITSFDAATRVNQSFFNTDTASILATRTVWFVNDTYSSSTDSFTTSTGSDATGNGSRGTPYLTITKALSAAKSGDTIIVDVGLYGETVTIDTDYISLIGKDSLSTVINPPGSFSIGIYSIGRKGLLIKNLGITGAYHGIQFDSVDLSTITGDSICSNSFYGIWLYNGCDTNEISSSIISFNTQDGIEIQSNSNNNTVRNNTISSNNSAGITIVTSQNNTIANNICNSNASAGLQLTTNCTGNVVINNVSNSNAYGIYLTSYCNYNRFSNNILALNSIHGVALQTSSNSNQFIQNDILSNFKYQVFISGGSFSDTFTKNNIKSSSTYPDSGVLNNTNNSHNFPTNWWGTTDELAINRMIYDSAVPKKINFRPYRLAIVDTAVGADTTAPLPPINVFLEASASEQIKLSWVIPVINEETNGGSVGYVGTKIYRIKNTPDTTHWANSNNLVRISSTTDTSWSDTGASGGDTYYYRLTSIDGATFVNESFFTDTKFGFVSPAYAGPVWYVNDTRTSSDSFTYTGGTDTWYGDGSKSRPFFTITKALSTAKSGDTIYIDAGLYSETVVIDTDYISLIGKDSNATVIDPPGANSTSGLYGIYADTQKGIVIKNIGLTGAYDGIHLYNVDLSTITQDSTGGCGDIGIYLRANSDTNTISDNTANLNSYSGIYLTSSSNNTVGSNTANSNAIGIYLTISCSNNTVTNNTINSNGDGIRLTSGSNSNTVSNNTANLNTSNGIYLDASTTNVVGNNTTNLNLTYGIYLNSSSSNVMSNNTVKSNSSHGIGLSWSSNNAVVQNTLDSNVQYQIYIIGLSSSDTVQKNNIKPSTTNPDSGVYNGTNNAFDFTRNYWNTTDSLAINKMIFDTATGKLVKFQPYRLGAVDTGPGADTTAPKAPDTVSASATAGAGTVLLTWAAVTANEEGVAGSPAVAQYRVYRATTADTSSWTLVGTPTGAALTDSGMTFGPTYYYRVTARDGAAFPNESFYSDSIAGAKPSAWTNAAEPMGASVGVFQSSIQWGDYDNDGDLDLAVSGSDVANNRLIIYRNDGGGSFTNVAEPMGANAGVIYSSIQWGDYDNDGDLDLAVSGLEGTNKRLIIYRNDGGGSFTNVAEPMGANAGVIYSSIQWGDYDNDGDLDLAVSGVDWSSNRRLIIYRNNGGGSFTNVAEPMGANAGVYYSSIRWGDYDNDGDLDLAVSGGDGSLNKRLIIYRNNGGGSFTNVAEPMGINAGVYNSSIQWGDYDNDGDLDLAVSGHNGANFRLIIYRNNSGGSFANVAEPMGVNAGVWLGSIQWADYDNDGDLDLAVSGDTGNNRRLIIYRNDAIAPANARPDASQINLPKGMSFTQGDTVTFRWTKVSTDTTPDTAMTYNLRVGSAPGRADIVAADTNSADSVGNTILGNVQNDTFAYLIRSLPAGTYYWSVQAVDGGMMRSAWAPEETFVVTVSYSGPKWYVNDLSVAGDSYTYVHGYDTQTGESTKPFRTISKALSVAKSGDTIYIDAGLYTEAVVIDSDYISIIGKDSNATVIDPPGSYSTAGLYGIYADTQTGLLIKNIGVTGAREGIKWVNVDLSTIIGDSISVCYDQGIYLINGSDTNTVSNNMVNENGSGIEIRSSSSNTISNNICKLNSDGITLSSSSNNNTVSNNLVSSNANLGIYLNSNSGNILSNNMCDTNTRGIYFSGSNNNTVSNNTANSNTNYGIHLISSTNNISGNTANSNIDGIRLESSSNNTVTGNTTFFNSNNGIFLYSGSNNNTIRNNTLKSNSLSGVYLNASSNNTLVQNTLDSNVKYQIYLDGASSSDTIQKNNINTSQTNPDSGVYNASTAAANKFTFTRNWWNTTDEIKIKKMVSGAPTGADSIVFIPYRLGTVDTTQGADTTAPAPPVLTVTATSDGSIQLTWAGPSTTEETNGGVVGYTGAKIYRLKNLPDTSNWANTVNLVHVATASESSWIDTTVTTGNNYYYRITSFDSASITNQSFFNSDTKTAYAQKTMWFVNDTYVSGSDSYTYASGSDTSGTGTKNSPYRTAAKALSFAQAGDTILIDRGHYPESFTIGIDSIWIIGVDSSPTGTIIDAGDSSSGSNLKVIYAANRSAIRISNLLIQRGFYGIRLDNVSRSSIENITTRNCGFGIYAYYSSADTIEKCVSTGNEQIGIDLDHCTYVLVQNSQSTSNSQDGMRLSYSDNNTVLGSTFTSNGTYGIYLDYLNSNNVFHGNSVIGNPEGIALGSSDNNFFSNNVSFNNSHGVLLNASNKNVFVQNTLDSNRLWQFKIVGASHSDTVQKNIIRTTPENPDSGVYVASTVTGNRFSFIRNWWGTTDEVSIKRKIYQESNGDSVFFIPYRLGIVDTVAGVDTTAPAPPANVTLDASAAGQIKVSWTIPTINEETNGGAVAYSGAKIYRLTNLADTTNWANGANLVYTATSTETTWNDNAVTGGNTYYYRLTSYDAGSPVNQSFFSDTTQAAASASSSVWTLVAQPYGAGTGFFSASIQWGDYDNDGDLDLVTSGTSGSGARLIIYRNVAGTFTNAAEPMGANAGVHQSSVQWGDYDKDGDLDLAVAGDGVGSGLRLTIFRNDGSGTFTNVWEGGGLIYASIQWGDYDNDGDLDLAVSGTILPINSTSPRLIIYRNDGGGTFTSAIEPMGVNVGVYKGSIQWGDYDNDGDIDLAVSGLDNSTSYRLTVYRNDGGETFINVAEPLGGSTSGLQLSSIQWGDYDNDGDLDLAVSGFAQPGGASTIIYRNDGGNTFTNVASLTGVQRSSIAWGDYDNDGDLDLLVSGYGPSSSRLIVFRNNGSDNFTNVAEPMGVNAGVDGSNGNSSVQWGDYDNDGDLDFAAAGYNSATSQYRLVVYRNDLTGPSNVRPPAPTLVSPKGTTFSQIDTVTLAWTSALGDATPVASQTYNIRVGTTVLSTNIAAADTNSSDSIGNTILGNVQNGTTASLKNLPHGQYFWSAQAVDGGMQRSVWPAPEMFIVLSSYSGPKWFVNDQYTAADSYTYSAGSDTLGNGSSTFPYRSIAKALSKAKSGDTIYVDAGLYSETVVIDTDYISLIGKDSGATVIDPPGDSSVSGLYGIYADTQVGLTVKNIGVTGALIGIHFLNVDLSAIVSDSVSSTNNGIYLLNGCDSNTLTNNIGSFNTNGTMANSSGIHLYGSSNLVSGNTTKSNGTNGIFVSGWNNTVSGNTSASNGNWGIGLYYGQGCTVTVNTVSGPTSDGIILQAGSNNVVQGNAISSTYRGIYIVSGSSSNLIQNNSSTGNSVGINLISSCTANTIINNTASSNSQYGIAAESSSGGNRIIGDTILTNSLYGVYISGSSNDNLVSNCRIASNTRAGAFIYNADTNTIAQNDVAGGDSGVWLYGTTRNNTIAKNNFYNNTIAAIGNSSGLVQNIARNWYGSTDESVIAARVRDTASSFLPYRFGPVDTALGVDTVAPKAPDTVVATAPQSSGQVNVSWSSVSANEEGVTGVPAVYQYQVYRAPMVDTSSWIRIGTSSGQTYTDTTATLGMAHHYRITTRDSATIPNESFYSDSIVSAKPSGFTLDTEMGVRAGSGVYDGSIQWGDYDRDGDLDLVISGQDGLYRRLIVFRNNGVGSFTNAAEPLIPGGGVDRSSIQWGDYDNDGDIDLAISGFDDNSTRRLVIYRNSGGGSFTSAVEPTSPGMGGVDKGSIQWGDYDNDGDLDLAVSGFDGVVRRLVLYRNNGDTTFTKVAEPMGAGSGLDESSIQWGDYDGDGDLDLAVSGYDGASYRFIIYRNNGGDSFAKVAEPMGASVGVYDGSIQWGDYDNDGDLDIAVSGRSITSGERFIIFRNSGGDNFINVLEPLGVNVGLAYSSIQWGDYDNDGDLDLAASGSRRVIIYRNNGIDSFTNVAEPMGVNQGVDYSSIQWGDYDNDGDLDLAVSGQSSTGTYRLILFRNDANGSMNIRPSMPTLLSPKGVSFLQGDTMVLTWSKVTTDSTSANAMTYNLRVGSAPGKADIVAADTNSSDSIGNTILGNVQNDTFAYLIRSLPAGAYYWSVQAVDGGMMRSVWAPEETFAITTPAPYAGPKWYVNDSYVVEDSYTYAFGSDTGGEGSPSKPYRSVAKALQKAKSGDTIFVDAGIYSETIVIDTNRISIIGVDSASTILEGGDSSLGRKGIFADTQSGLLVKNLGIRNYHAGIEWVNVDSSTLENVTVRLSRDLGITLTNNSDSNSIINCLVVDNSNSGIFLNAYSNMNTLIGNTCSNNLAYGFLLQNANSNILKNNKSVGNSAAGFILNISCASNILMDNYSAGNAQYGFFLNGASNNNKLDNNRAHQNAYFGVWLSTSSSNVLSNNSSTSNFSHGYYLSSAETNVFVQNASDSNGGYQFYLDGTSTANTIVKNNITPASVNRDSGVFNGTNQTVNFSRNWWSTTDELAIANRLKNAAGGSVTYVPYRLGPADTSAGADTTAPAPPATVILDTVTAGQIQITWTIPTVNEETNGGSVGHAGVNIYRLTNVADTNNWANPANLVWTAGASDTSWIDTAVAAGNTYFYRLTSFDAATRMNQSFFTDTKGTKVSTVVSVTAISPASGYETNSIWLRFEWSSPTAETYTWQLSRTSSFSTSADSVVDTKVTALVRNLPYEDTFYWRVIAKDTYGAVDTTAARSVMLDASVGQVSILSPADGYETSNTKLLVSWVALADSVSIDSFIVEVSKSTLFTALIFTDTVSGLRTSDTLSNLYNDTYFWRVRAIDRLGNIGANSQARGFVVDTSAGQVLLDRPADAHETTNVKPVVSWFSLADSVGINFYVVEVSKTTAFSTLVFVDTVASNRTTDTLTGLYNDTYFWRVRGIDKLGNTLDSPPSRRLVVDTDAAAVSSLLLADGHETTNVRPVVSWGAVIDGVGIDSYVIEVSLTPSFSSLVFADTIVGTRTSDTLILSANDTYYWRIRSIDKLGNLSSYSSPRGLVIDTFVVQVTLVSPANGVAIVDTKPALTWQSVSDSVGIDSFVVEVSRTSAFMSFVFVDTVRGSLTTDTVPALTEEDTYYWRVRAVDHLKNIGLNSTTFAFRFDTGVKIILASPGNGLETTSAILTFSWSTDDAETYTWQMSNAASFSVLTDSVVDTSAASIVRRISSEDTFYWRVIGRDRVGKVDTAVRVFLLDTHADRVELASPADQQETTTSRPVLSWKNLADSVGIDSYVLELSSSPTFSSLLFADTVSASRTSDTVANLSDGTYYWRVRAIDRLRNVGLNSTSRRFRVAVPGLPTKIILLNNHQLGTHSTILPSPLCVVLKDDTGNPVPGQAVTFSIAVPAGGAGASLALSTVITDNSGMACDTLTLGARRGPYHVAVTVASNSALKDAFVAYADGLEISKSVFKMIAPNKSLTVADVQNAIKAKFPLSNIGEWNQDAGTAAGERDYVTPSALVRGRGYWIFDPQNASGTIDFQGTAGYDTITVALKTGWHQVGSGQYFYVSWDSDVRFDTGDKKLTPAKAEAAGLIQNAVYWWNGSSDYTWGPDINRPSLSAIHLKPTVGFFMYAKKACNMTIYPNPSVPPETAAEVLNQAPKLLSAVYQQDAASDQNWTIQLTAAAGGMQDFQNYIGVVSKAEEATAAERYEPPPVASNFVSLGVVAENGNRLAAAYAEPVTTARSWSLGVSSDLKDNILLNWNNLESVPEKYGAYLVGLPQGPVNLRKSSSAVLAAGSSLKLTVAVGLPEYLGAFLSPNLDKSQTFVYPNPGPDGTTGSMTFKYNLQVAGDVTLKIYDVGGRLVREFKHQGNPGSNLVIWDTTNRFGQKVGSGVYIYILETPGTKLVDKLAVAR